jgi:SAM-dependent methyltransferase
VGTPQTGEYWLGAGDTERARLLAQGCAYRAQAELLFDRIGVVPGWHALDMGCGPLGVLDILADRVGPQGLVVGLDREPEMLRMAQAALTQRDLRGARLVRGDIGASGLPACSFDLVHGRLIFVNNRYPRNNVTEMVRLARPGEYVALQDMDKLSWICEPAHPAWDRLMSAFRAARAAAGLDEFIGRRLPGMLRAAGIVDISIVDISIDAHTDVWRSGDTNQTKLLHFTGIFRDHMLATGELSETELDASVAELAAHLANPDTFVLNGILFQAWGRKPVPT